jgi:hypothetical protein
MSFLTVMEFNKKYNKNQNETELNILDEEGILTINEGFIEWDKEDSVIWCAPYEGETCYIELYDYTKHEGLKTEKQIIKDCENYVKLSVFNFPYELKEYIKNLSGKHRYQLTKKEREFLITKMSKEELKEYNEKVECDLNHFLKESLQGYPSIEKPFRIYMSGNDDLSYSAVFETNEKMMEAFENIVLNPFKTTMDKYNFIFTN